MIQKRLSEAMDDRIDPAQFGFRKVRAHHSLYTYTEEYKKSTKKRGWNW